MSLVLESNYVTCRMIGRLGNQMFQIANAYAQSLRHKRQLVIPGQDTSVSDYFETIHRKLTFTSTKSPEPSPDVHIIDATYYYTPYEPHSTKPTVFRGYFESEKYFKDYAEEVRTLFEPTLDFLESTYKEYPQLKIETNAAINVRRGDFLTFPRSHPVITLDYIYRAVEMLPKVDTIYVLSDDLEWCQQNIKLPNVVFVDYKRHKALWFLSLCQNFVISNSTFSWWGAYLSRAPKKVVIAPEVWFGPDILANTNPKDILCEDWVKCPARYDPTGFIYPL